MRLQTKLLPHQKEGVRLIDAFEGDALLADEMGLGKSLTSLAWSVKYKQFPILILCPAALKYNWQEEIRHHFGERSLVLEGRTIDVQEQYAKKANFIILNFQILAAWLLVLKKIKPTTLILDECQSISNRESQSYQNFTSLRESCHNLIALSGTPLTNRPSELWPILNALRPDIWPSFFTYAVEHCEPRRERGRMVYKGARNLPHLHRKAKKYCMIRRLKTDVLNLPPKVRSVVPLPISSSSEYRNAETDFKKWLTQNKGISALIKSKKAYQLSKMMQYRQLVIEAKMNSIIKWVENFLEETDEKLVLMFCHTDPIVKMMKHFKKVAVRVDGHVTGMKRHAAVREFQVDGRCRLFIGNVKAAGVGLTLTAANHLAYCELPWTPGDVKQGEDRIHRISQTDTCFIYYLVANGSIEEQVAKMIAKKDDILNTVLDKGRNEKWEVSDLLRS